MGVWVVALTRCRPAGCALTLRLTLPTSSAAAAEAAAETEPDAEATEEERAEAEAQLMMAEVVPRHSMRHSALSPSPSIFTPTDASPQAGEGGEQSLRP